jgi:Protein of unknown function (DUF3826)
MKGFRLVNTNIQPANDVMNNTLFTSINTFISYCLVNTKNTFLAITLLVFNVQIFAQPAIAADTTYQKVIAERTAKIVTTLGIVDSIKYKTVQQQLAVQYFQLNAIQNESKATITSIKTKQLSHEDINDAIKKEEEKRSFQLKQLHAQFIAQLQKELTANEIEKIKDGMTYKVLPVTWAAYMDMLQHLTTEQKDKMYNWLLEARELAMDEGSSDAKHAVFGKYKGKINNFLSAAGYDMKKEGEDWAKRILAAKESKQAQN